MHGTCRSTQVKYLNNIVGQDHRFIKKRVGAMLGFESFRTARRFLHGIEAIHMIRKGQIKIIALFEVQFINRLFGIAS